MGNCDITFIMPCYNSGQHAARCAESILKQRTDLKCDIICVDDGSDEQSLDVLRGLEKKYGITVISCPHGGTSVARNEGLKKARGRYVWFVDSDDQLPEGALEYIAEAVAIKPHGRAAYDAVYFGAYINNGTDRYTLADIAPDERLYGEKSEEQEFNPPSPCLPAFFEERACTPYVWNTLFRRQFLKEHKIRFMNGMTIGEDMVFQTEVLMRAKKIKICGGKVYIYNYLSRENSAMKLALTSGSNFLRRQTEIAAEVVERFYRQNLADDYSKELGSWLYSFCLKDILRERRRERLKLFDGAYGGIIQRYGIDTGALPVKARVKIALLRTPLLRGIANAFI